MAGVLGLALVLAAGGAVRADVGSNGYATGRSHYAAVLAHPNLGVEAGMPRGGWYGRGVNLDLEQRWQESYKAFGRARDEFDAMLSKRPRWAEAIEAWKEKAEFQRDQSRRLVPRRYSRWYHRPSYRVFEMAEAMYHKWLAARAFRGRLDRRLGRAVVDAFQKVLQQNPRHDKARLGLAAALHLLGERVEAQRQFAKVRRYMLGGFALQTAHYYAVAGDKTRALEYLTKAVRYRSSRKLAETSNYFDTLRGDPRFQKLLDKR